MDNKSKQVIMQQLDLHMGAGDIVGLNTLLQECNDNFENYPVKFLQLILGYVGVYQKKLDTWMPLYEKVNEEIEKNQ